MDNKGFIFTIDAALAIIPLLIIVMAVSNSGSPSMPQHATSNYNTAQDTMNIIAAYQEGGKPFMQIMVDVLEANNNSEIGIRSASELVTPLLSKSLDGKSYKLIETSQLKGTVISAGGNLKNSPHVSVASRNWGNYTFELQVGD